MRAAAHATTGEGGRAAIGHPRERGCGGRVSSGRRRRRPVPVVTAALAAAHLLLTSALEGSAQEPAGDPAADEAVRVYLLTMGPGDRVWEKFGHNALWFHHPAGGADVVYNWGIFSFQQEDFFRRLLFGHMRYMVVRTTLGRTLRQYRAQDRSVRARRLRLTSAQVDELRRRARVAARPENREYSYDPFRDNCSTRIRDLLDRVVDGRLRAATDSVGPAGTYRSHTRRLLQRVGWAYAGITAMLGASTDRPLTAWEEMFLPLRMEDRLRTLTVGRGEDAGALAGPAEEIVDARRRPAPVEGPGFHVAAPLVGLFGGALLAVLGLLGRRGRAGARPAFGWLAGGWSLAAGLAGLVMAAGWVLTDHWYVQANENLLQLQPLSLALAVAAPSAALAGRGRRAAVLLAWATAGLALLGAALQLLPAFDQVNGEVVALALPLHLGLAVGLGADTG